MRPRAKPEIKRVALVTGGARRVGRAIVERLFNAKFDIAFTFWNSEEDATGLYKWIQKRRGECLLIQADLSDPAKAARHIRNTFLRKFGRLDVLVHNASLYQPIGFDQIKLEDMRRFMSIHYESPLLITRGLSTTLRQSRGHVVNMVDLLAERPWPQYMAYSASKAALLNLTLSLARELAPKVTVNGIAPGVVQWPEGYPEEEQDKYLKRVPLKREGTPQDVANLVHFLATEGSYITGQIIRLDGGRSIT